MRIWVRPGNALPSVICAMLWMRWQQAERFGMPGLTQLVALYRNNGGFMLLRIALVLVLTLPVISASPAAMPQQAQSRATFSEHVAPIVFNRCASCHRPGEAGPFPLLSYDDVRKRAKLIASVTQKRYMPPWHGSSDM